ncbi:MAG TPA: hypothetical protein GXX20_09460 [Clostridiaceae bacterium]|nr:hypothetical protein [Clostridiaceae bacterium]
MKRRDGSSASRRVKRRDGSSASTDTRKHITSAFVHPECPNNHSAATSSHFLH